jgi:hypothetical protein
MKVDPKTCSVHYILYLRFYKISLFKMLDLFPLSFYFLIYLFGPIKKNTIQIEYGFEFSIYGRNTKTFNNREQI